MIYTFISLAALCQAQDPSAQGPSAQDPSTQAVECKGKRENCEGCRASVDAGDPDSCSTGSIPRGLCHKADGSYKCVRGASCMNNGYCDIGVGEVCGEGKTKFLFNWEECTKGEKCYCVKRFIAGCNKDHYEVGSNKDTCEKCAPGTHIEAAPYTGNDTTCKGTPTGCAENHYEVGSNKDTCKRCAKGMGLEPAVYTGGDTTCEVNWISGIIDIDGDEARTDLKKEHLTDKIKWDGNPKSGDRRKYWSGESADVRLDCARKITRVVVRDLCNFYGADFMGGMQVYIGEAKCGDKIPSKTKDPETDPDTDQNGCREYTVVCNNGEGIVGDSVKISGEDLRITELEAWGPPEDKNKCLQCGLDFGKVATENPDGAKMRCECTSPAGTFKCATGQICYEDGTDEASTCVTLCPANNATPRSFEPLQRAPDLAKTSCQCGTSRTSICDEGQICYTDEASTCVTPSKTSCKWNGRCGEEYDDKLLYPGCQCHKDCLNSWRWPFGCCQDYQQCPGVTIKTCDDETDLTKLCMDPKLSGTEDWSCKKDFYNFYESCAIQTCDKVSDPETLCMDPNDNTRQSCTKKLYDDRDGTCTRKRCEKGLKPGTKCKDEHDYECLIEVYEKLGDACTPKHCTQVTEDLKNETTICKVSRRQLCTKKEYEELKESEESCTLKDCNDETDPKTICKDSRNETFCTKEDYTRWCGATITIV